MHPVTTEQLSACFDLFDPPQRARKLDNKTALSCLLFLLETGVAWKHLPVGDFSASAVYKRLRHWIAHGVIDKVWRHLSSLYAGQQLRREPGWFKTVFIDSTMIKNLGGVDVVGRNPTDRGRLGSKLSVVCDQNRVPLGRVLYPANRHDCKTVEETLASVACPLREDGRRTVHLVGDKAYGTREIEAMLRARNMRLVAESKRNAREPRRLTRSDRQKLARRHRIENLFCRLKQFKRVRHRMDALASVYEAQVTLVFCCLVVPQLQLPPVSPSSQALTNTH